MAQDSFDRLKAERMRQIAEEQRQNAARNRQLAAGALEAQNKGQKPSDVQMAALQSQEAGSTGVSAATSRQKQARAQLAAKGFSEGVVQDSAGNTDTASSVTGGAATGAATGFAVGGGPVGAAIGGVIGAGTGILKASANRKKVKRQAEAVKHEQLGAIEGSKGQRISSALQDMRQAFSSALRVPQGIRLGGR
jgi:hypothetical protein